MKGGTEEDEKTNLRWKNDISDWIAISSPKLSHGYSCHVEKKH